MTVLKKNTKGLCSKCYTIVGARVVAEKGRAVIIKKCPKHGLTRGIIEKDLGFFKKVIEGRDKKEPFPPSQRMLMINIAHECNLNCRLCYLTERDKRLNFKLSEVKELIRDYPGHTIIFSGGEPTLHEKLPEMIRYAASRKKITAVVTNGVRLSDPSFVEELKDAGLSYLNFSMNGFTDNVFKKIENAKLLKIKLKALANVKKYGIKTQLSFTMAKGINEDQFGKVIQYALDNNDFIFQVRARVATGIGRNIGEKNIFLSDFIKQLARVTNIPYGIILDHWLSKNAYPNAYYFNIEYFGFLMDAAISQKLGLMSEPGQMEKYLSKYVGKVNASRLVSFDPRDPGRPVFTLVLFSWPDRHNIDYEEIKGLNLDTVTRDKRIVPYWDGIIRNERYNFL